MALLWLSAEVSDGVPGCPWGRGAASSAPGDWHCPSSSSRWEETLVPGSRLRYFSRSTPRCRQMVPAGVGGGWHLGEGPGGDSCPGLLTGLGAAWEWLPHNLLCPGLVTPTGCPLLSRMPWAVSLWLMPFLAGDPMGGIAQFPDLWPFSWALPVGCSGSAGAGAASFPPFLIPAPSAQSWVRCEAQVCPARCEGQEAAHPCPGHCPELPGWDGGDKPQSGCGGPRASPGSGWAPWGSQCAAPPSRLGFVVFGCLGGEWAPRSPVTPPL